MKMKNVNESKDEFTIISSGVTIEGKVSCNANIRIDGNVKGDVIAKGNITIGETGEVNGQVQADVITLGGNIFGSVNAKEKIVLESKSVLKGDLSTRILVIEAGAKFDGKSNMSSSKELPVHPPQGG